MGSKKSVKLVAFRKRDLNISKENKKHPIAIPGIAFRPKIITAVVPRPIAGKNGYKLISNTNINRVNMPMIIYAIAILRLILVLEFKKEGI